MTDGDDRAAYVARHTSVSPGAHGHVHVEARGDVIRIYRHGRVLEAPLDDRTRIRLIRELIDGVATP